MDATKKCLVGNLIRNGIEDELQFYLRYQTEFLNYISVNWLFLSFGEAVYPLGIYLILS